MGSIDTSPSKDYIFHPRTDGGLIFVGDFEGLYRAEEDPWGQSGTDKRLGAYYANSRDCLAERLKCHGEFDYLLEVGSGLGYAAAHLQDRAVARHIEGLDISHTAVDKARRLFPRLTFHTGSITSPQGNRFRLTAAGSE